MSFAKVKLKAARDFIAKKDFAAARDSAEKVLEFEPDNYNATVFLGLAYLELGDFDKSEQAYRRAIELNSEQLLAWQGLSKFYERTEEWDKYADTLQHLLGFFAKSGDAVKCAETIQKFVQNRREHGHPLQVVDAISLYLPTSPHYALLSTLPPPDPTNPTSTTTFEAQEAVHNGLPILEETVRILEKDEADKITREFEKRRTRLGAGTPEQIKKDVGVEVWSVSRLPPLYNDILNHPNTSDELRRETETKLLKHKQQYLYALPNTSEQKKKVLQQVEELINGAIILQLPDELAWALFLERKDVETIDDYEYPLLRQYMALFPSHPLVSMLKGYFIYNGIPLTDDEEDEDAEIADPDTGLDMIFDAQPQLVDSLLGTRVLADVYLREVDYPAAIKAAQSGMELARRAEVNHGKTLPHVILGFKVILATSLVHLFPPKHHARALSIIDDVLATSPNNISCLMGRAHILEQANKWEEAGDLFSRVHELLPDDVHNGLRAKEEHAWCRSRLGDFDFAVAALKEVLETMDTLDHHVEESARCLWRLGSCHWDMNGDQREEAYKYFITALKRDSMYAPAFTSLGIYYEEYATPPDPNRASKCFQKAFELDSREVYAARRLAVGFAEEQEWDLVETVARRTIDGEGGSDAGLGPSTVYLPMNAWAWKAVGAVELARRKYDLAIHAYQVALRAEPEDQVCWLRLGEAYSKSGRHAAALKALARAQELNPEDWMTLYFIGDVRRQTGQFQEAIDIFTQILHERPGEIGVSVLLGQSYLDLGRSELSGGYVARAERSFLDALHVALAASSSGFGGVVWKIAADALFALSTFVDESVARRALGAVFPFLSTHSSDRLAGFDINIQLPDDSAPLTGAVMLQNAIVAYDLRLSVASSDPQAIGSAWFDLGIALGSYASQLTDEEKSKEVEKKRIEFLGSALRQCPLNEEYWTALGNAYFLTQAKSAQHAYIRALEIDSKNTATWTNLGLLYLYHDDVELANEALYRAQTLDPDYTLAWVGQALVATANGHESDARALLEHAVGLSSSVPAADLEFSARSFALNKTSPSPSPESLLPSLSLLSRYLSLNPSSAPGLHLSSLVHETLGHLDTALSLLTSAITILETAYEETESPEIERQYVIAQSNMGRMRNSTGDYAGAAEAFQIVINLLPESETDDPETRVLRTQAHFGLGLARLRQGLEFEGAFGNALESAGGDLVLSGHVSVLMAKTMWALGDETSRDEAKNMLLQCITNDPENLAAINALAAMGILTDDENLVDAALSEILALPREQRASMDPEKDVEYLLMKHHEGLGEDAKVMSLAQQAIISEPSRSQARIDLAKLTMQRGLYESVLPIITGPSTSTLDVQRNEIGVRAIALSMSGAGELALREAQKAVLLAPWDKEKWLTLVYVRSVLE
ncbi:TPR-like protein [Desarmillaria tabescens]|uniref:TPR-like protein n=1 Tax=Armillaria tabescens TaxID=1929756 RepID=A0AA39JFI6_ARMTA|nr:TPR-like protein [Desarmillaria tabescens]KAK0440394.1 TPR-like protein [Desarmillaria tabescens]